jgi:hypothetical protein
MRFVPVLFALTLAACGTAGRDGDDPVDDAAPDADATIDAVADSVSDSATEAAADSASDSATEAAPDSRADSAADSATEAAPDSAGDSAGDSATEAAADAAADSAPDAAPDAAADSASDSAADSAPDTAPDAAPDAAPGPIKGGPCASGATGATAFRLRWAGSGPGSTAYVVYEVEGLPNSSTLKAGAYGTSIGYTPVFDDTYLGVGGLVLSGTNFVDVDFSTLGVTSIKRATLSIHGRSFATTTSGSYTWQTFDGVGATPSGAVANSAPYQWYGPLPYLGSGGPIGDVTAVILPGKTVKLRIKAGGPSSSLIVHWIELCLDAT